MQRAEYMILITDKNLAVQGNPILNWDTLDYTLRFNEPGSGYFACPGYPWIREQISPGSRVMVIRHQATAPATVDPAQIVIAGPIEDALHERSDDGENAGDGKLTVTFADDLSKIVAREVYPDPAVAPPTPPAVYSPAQWTYTGNAETAIRNLVNLNAGPGALTARRLQQLTLGAVAGVGSSITVTAQAMEPLGDVARRAALAGGGLGFRTRQVGSGIVFDVYDPVDKTGSVRFGFAYGNLKYLGYQVTAPKATTAIVGGQGEGADKAFITRTNSTDETGWGRYEALVSRPGTSTTLAADGDEYLSENGASSRVTCNVVDTQTQRFGVHYGLGDLVTIESWPGQEIADVVRSVHVQAWSTAGEIVSAIVGSQAATYDKRQIAALREIDRRVGRIERTVKPAA